VTVSRSDIWLIAALVSKPVARQPSLPGAWQPTKETYGEAKAEGSASRGDTVAFLGRLAGDGCGVLTEVPFDLGGQHKGKAS
jgi:hypothetical protein